MSTTVSTYELAGRELTLRVSDELFEPNTTTQKIAEQLEIPADGSVLDMGCGVGPLGIYAAMEGASHVDAIDVMPSACELTKENAERNGVGDKVSVWCGNLFEPVAERQYDVIVNDVSGLADRVARISPWYPWPVPTGGEDGTDHVLRVLNDSPKHLTPRGVLYFAASSLSNVPKILRHAREIFGDQLERLASHRIPFCPELTTALDEVRALREQGKISFEEKRSRQIWTLELFRAAVA